MTLLGTEGFQIGVAAPAATTTTGMDLSLDEIIQRRNQQQQKPKSIKKAVSNADRSIATSRAKRNAAMAARRGQQTNTKPTNMQVEQEIKKQVSKTAIAKARSTRPVKAPRPSGAGGGAPGGGPRRPTNNNATSVGKSTGAEKAAARRKKREVIKQGKAAVAVLKPPSKKAVTAAVNAMQSAGFTIPQGQQLVISFAPIPGTVAATVKGPAAANNGPPKSNASNNNKSGGPPKSNTNNNKSRGGNNNNRNNNRK